MCVHVVRLRNGSINVCVCVLCVGKKEECENEKCVNMCVKEMQSVTLYVCVCEKREKCVNM